MQSNPKVTNIPINAMGGAWTQIVLTIMASKVVVQEDPNYNAGVAQGLTGYFLDPALPPGSQLAPAVGAQIQVWLPNSDGQQGPAYEPIIFGGADGRVHGGEGNYVGGGAQTAILLLTTNSATAGGIILQEWP